jgi:integrase
MLTAAEQKFGRMPIAVLNDQRVRSNFIEWRDEVAISSGYREGDFRLATISAMLTWASERQLIATNHLKGFKRLYHSDRSQIIWMPGHIAAFLKVAPIEMKRAMILALNTGQRQGDLLRLPWSAYDGTAIRLRQSKTGAEVVIPCTKELKDMLDSMPRISPLILTTKSGRAFTGEYFRQLWTATARKAKIEKLHFHDIRGTTITRLAESGCTIPQIAAVTEHRLQTVSSILEKYLARTHELARQAISMWDKR